MEALNLLADLESRASASGKKLAAACTSAGVAFSTLRRWRKGITTPTMSTYLLVVAAINGEELASRPKRKKAATPCRADRG